MTGVRVHGFRSLMYTVCYLYYLDKQTELSFGYNFMYDLVSVNNVQSKFIQPQDTFFNLSSR